MRKERIGRKNPCPCGSGKKYEKCFLGKVNWSELKIKSFDEQARYLSVKGKNISFIHAIANALQLDTITGVPSVTLLKKACTPQAVKKIYESIIDIWPDGDDTKRIYSELNDMTSGIYCGVYDPEHILKGITRHALYSSQILLFDVFSDPRILKQEFNPIVVPEKYLTTAMRNIIFGLHYFHGLMEIS